MNKFQIDTFLNILSTKCKNNYDYMKKQNIFLYRRRWFI